MALVAQELSLKNIEGFYAEKYPFFSFTWVRNIFVGRVKSVTYGGDNPFINITPLVGDCTETVYKRKRYHSLSGFSKSIVPINPAFGWSQDKLELGIESNLTLHEVEANQLVAFELGEDGYGKTVVKSYFSIEEDYIQSVIKEFVTEGSYHYRFLFKNQEMPLPTRDYFSKKQSITKSFIQESIDECALKRISLKNSIGFGDKDFAEGKFFDNGTWSISIQALKPIYKDSRLVDLVWEPLPKKAQELYQLVS